MDLFTGRRLGTCYADGPGEPGQTAWMVQLQCVPGYHDPGEGSGAFFTVRAGGDIGS